MFDYEINGETVAMAAEVGVRKYSRVLEEMGFVNGIDEVAILVPDALALLRLTEALVRLPGIALSNAATDHVNVNPLRTCYSVDYFFFTGFQVDGVHDYRLEVMALKNGHSPLHNLVAHDAGGQMPFVHASFKVQTEEEYGAACHRIKTHDYEVVQKCDSTYGKFSYWQPLDANEDEKAEFMWLKPRVNLRDAKVALS